MGTSENNGEVLYDASELATDRFVDTVLARDFVSTAMHKADEAAQHVATWVAPVPALVTLSGVDGYPDPWLEPELGGGAMLVGAAGVDGTRYYSFGIRAVYAPKVRAAGDAYRLRVWIAGSSSDGGEVDFGVIVAPRLLGNPLTGGTFGGEPGAEPGETSTWPYKLYSGITSTTAAALTPDIGSHIITIDATVIDASFGMERPQSTLVDIGGASATVTYPGLVAIPFCQTLNSGTVPRLHGFAAHEFVGAS